MASAYTTPESIDESIAYSITISDLLRVPFDRRTETDKIQIVLGDKPRPSLKLSGITLTGNKDITVDFKTTIYDEIPWITGCERKNTMFCWPCLLFGQPSVWNSTGFSDILLLADESSKHEKSLSHVEAVEKVDKFIEKIRTSKDENKTSNPSNESNHLNSESFILHSKTPQPKEIIHVHLPESQEHENTSMKAMLPQLLHSSLYPTPTLLAENNCKMDTELMKKLIDICCFEFHLRHSNEKFAKSLFESEKYTRMIQLLKSYDHCNSCFYDDVSYLIKKFPENIDTAFNVIVKFVESVIKQEIQSSKYVALIFNQHGEIESEQKFSTILRYMKNGLLQERFVGFRKVSGRMSADVLYDHFKAILQKYEIGDKICSLSLDGSILCTADLLYFMVKVKSCHKYCLFLPWYEHSINLILQQSLSRLPKCRQFFRMMASLQTYFQNNSEELNKLINENYPALSYIYSDDKISCTISNRFASSEFIITVKNFRQDLIHFLNFVLKTYQNMNGPIVAELFIFRKYLKQLETIFLLEVLTRLFKLTYSLNTSLKNNEFEFCNGKQNNLVYEFMLNINKFRVGKYNEIWNCIKDVSQELNYINECAKMKEIYFSLFNQIIFQIIQEIDIRYQPLIKLTFLNMFNFLNNGGLDQFPLWIQGLIETNREFDETQMHNELVVVLNHDEFYKNSVTDFHKHLSEFNLHYMFKTLSNLSELIIVMLFKPTSDISNVSKLQIIEKLCNSNGSSSYDHVSILHIEYDILQTSHQLLSFHDHILSIYADKDLDTQISTDSNCMTVGSPINLECKSTESTVNECNFDEELLKSIKTEDEHVLTDS